MPKHAKPTEARDLFRRAQEARSKKMSLSALRLAEEAAAIDARLPGVHRLRAECLAGLGRFKEAIEAADEEIRLKVQAGEAEALRRAISLAWSEQRVQAKKERKWSSDLSPEIIAPLEQAAHRYTYRGHAMIKNPFDFALYPMLLWNLKPASIIEIGSFNGASALWMADTMRAYGVESHVWSLDVVAVTAIEDPAVTFMAGSGRQLAKSFTAEMLASCPRPFLVIDDADHTYETSKAVLEFFHPYMKKGEYIVVEDGLTAAGPELAIVEFLAERGETYAVDSELCDFFGYNATWCVNGFLKRTSD